MTTVDSSVLILGAGVFGLSTALHLKRAGYKSVKVLDRQPFEKNHYNPADGCDGASADINKIFRTTYGNRKPYQDLATRALPIWKEWTRNVHLAPEGSLPLGLQATDTLYDNCGFMRLAAGREMSQYHSDNLDAMEKEGSRHEQFVLNDAAELKRLEELDAVEPGNNWVEKLTKFSGLRGGNTNGFLETAAGLTRADKACRYALHLAQQAGVEFVLDSRAGRFESLIRTESRVAGVVTADGSEHRADVVIVACGGWTASVVPEAIGLLETTGGSVAYIDLPTDRQDLWDKFAPARCPAWSYQGTGKDPNDLGGFVCFDGRIKFGFRGRKYTHFETHPVTGQRLSVPITKYTDTRLTNLPLEAINNIKQAVQEAFPELAEIGLTDTRMCWYTDSIDNDFVIDYVPGYHSTLFVASAGSGHGFKFLPVLGEHVVNQLERKHDEFTELWKWRQANGLAANGLEEGELGDRVLAKQKMATKDDWAFR